MVISVMRGFGLAEDELGNDAEAVSKCGLALTDFVEPCGRGEPADDMRAGSLHEARC